MIAPITNWPVTSADYPSLTCANQKDIEIAMLYNLEQLVAAGGPDSNIEKKTFACGGFKVLDDTAPHDLTAKPAYLLVPLVTTKFLALMEGTDNIFTGANLTDVDIPKQMNLFAKCAGTGFTNVHLAPGGKVMAFFTE